MYFEVYVQGNKIGNFQSRLIEIRNSRTFEFKNSEFWNSPYFDLKIYNKNIAVLLSAAMSAGGVGIKTPNNVNVYVSMFTNNVGSVCAKLNFYLGSYYEDVIIVDEAIIKNCVISKLESFIKNMDSSVTFNRNEMFASYESVNYGIFSKNITLTKKQCEDVLEYLKNGTYSDVIGREYNLIEISTIETLSDEWIKLNENMTETVLKLSNENNSKVKEYRKQLNCLKLSIDDKNERVKEYKNILKEELQMVKVSFKKDLKNLQNNMKKVMGYK